MPSTTASSRYDEVVDPAGQPRRHWARLAQATFDIADTELVRRARSIQQAVEQDGVTYNVHGDPKGTDRLWEVDMLPLVIGAEEWRFLAAAVKQRARLLNAVLADLYGPGRLIKMGLIPPAIIYGHHNYLWPCRDLKPAGGTHLHLYGCDLARSPDGRWWVINDRTQGPSGAGYALQNRRIVAPLYGSLFRSLGVQGLGRFFRMLQDQLSALAPVEGDSPNVVLLTPGPYSETYFEHLFLARHLGYTLAEGSDLTVRNDRVFLKTLSGLRRVHVILRRLDDEFCDPVALRADSALGIPGLVSAARAGQVVIANALGSGVVESPALLGFLPAICETLLGESLALPSVATWWCGEAPALAHAVDHLQDLVVKPAFPSMRREPTFGHALDSKARDSLIASMRATPHAYVAQEHVRLSQAPTWSYKHDRFESRVIGLRLFAASTQGGYEVMNGGLSRVSPESGAEVISIQRGGSSKDTWILGDALTAPDTKVLRPHRITARDIVRSGAYYPSRSVENLFWMGRYSERIAGLSRLLRVTAHRLVLGELPNPIEVGVFVDLCIGSNLRAARSPDEGETERLSDEWLLAAVADSAADNGLPANISRLVHCVSQVRERISLDNWNIVQRLTRIHLPRPRDLESAILVLDHVAAACTSLAGHALDGMTRDDAWHFLLIGRQIERIQFISSTLGFILAAPAARQEAALTGLLELGNSLITYRARYQRQPELIPVMDLLALDPTNPHAVAYQMHELASQVDALTRRYAFTPRSDPRTLLPCVREATTTNPGYPSLPSMEPSSPTASLAAILEACQTCTLGLAQEIETRFFVHIDDRAQATGQT